MPKTQNNLLLQEWEWKATKDKCSYLDKQNMPNQPVNTQICKYQRIWEQPTPKGGRPIYPESRIEIYLHEDQVLGLLDPWRWDIGFTETSVRNYRCTLRNIPEERRSHLHRGRSLKSHKCSWLTRNVCWYVVTGTRTHSDGVAERGAKHDVWTQVRAKSKEDKNCITEFRDLHCLPEIMLIEPRRMEWS